MKRFTIFVALCAACLSVTTANTLGSNQSTSISLGTWTGVTLRWTAPGDDGSVGRAEIYDIRYSTQYITEENWDQATPVEYSPFPRISGTEQSCCVSRLVDNQFYCFALKTADEYDNWSALSNVYVTRAHTQSYTCGDVNGDGVVTLSDVTVLLGFLFREGDPPSPLDAANTNASIDCKVTLSDVSRLIDYLFIRGEEPFCY